MSVETVQAASSSQPASEEVVSDVNWAELDGDFSADLGGAEDSAPTQAPTSEAVETPVAVQAPQTPPVASPAQPQTSAQQPAQAVQQPQTPQQVEQPQQLPTGMSPEEQLAQYENALVQGYALSEEDAVALLTQPETVFPKLAKNLHMNVMREVQQQMQHMMQAVPQMLKFEAERVAREESAKTDFFGVWPGLKDHYQAVVGNAHMVRKANPNATREQIVEMAGTLTAMGLGLDPATLRAAAQRAVVQQPQRPVRPIGPAGSPAGVPQKPQNTFSQFADEDLNWG